MKASEKQKEKYRQYYIDNKQRWNKYRKAPKTLEQKLASKLKKQQWKANHPEIYLWSCVKYRARKDSIDFNLEVSDIMVPSRCPYLDIELTSLKGRGYLDNLMSVDRIDPKLGYIKGNVEVISYKANRMKNDASIDELITFARSIINRYD